MCMLLGGPTIPEETDWNEECIEEGCRQPHLRFVNAIVGICQSNDCGVRGFGNHNHPNHETQSNAKVCEPANLRVPVVDINEKSSDGGKDEIDEAEDE